MLGTSVYYTYRWGPSVYSTHRWGPSVYCTYRLGPSVYFSYRLGPSVYCTRTHRLPPGQGLAATAAGPAGGPSQAGWALGGPCGGDRPSTRTVLVPGNASSYCAVHDDSTCGLVFPARGVGQAGPGDGLRNFQAPGGQAYCTYFKHV